MAETQIVTSPPAEMDAENHAPTLTTSQIRKRPRLDLEVEPRKKTRSVFGQVFGTLRKAREEDKQLKTSDAAKKRSEIDARIMGKITRDQNLVRQQDEAKRDRVMANRKEDDLAIKDSIMRFRAKTYPRLAGFLLTSDIIPLEPTSKGPMSSRPTSPAADRKTLGHPPPMARPPPLYFLPAILTPAQSHFLKEQKKVAESIVAEESTEWAEDKRKGLEEIAELRRKAEEAAEEAKRTKKEELDAKVEEKMEVEDAKVTDEKVQASEPPIAPTTKEPREKEEDHEEDRPAPMMDAEDTIEY